jgi:hypothetical protein
MELLPYNWEWQGISRLYANLTTSLGDVHHLAWRAQHPRRAGALSVHLIKLLRTCVQNLYSKQRIALRCSGVRVLASTKGCFTACMQVGGVWLAG